MPGPIRKKPMFILNKISQPESYVWPYIYRIDKLVRGTYTMIYDMVYETNYEHEANERFDALVREHQKENPPVATVTIIRKSDF